MSGVMVIGIGNPLRGDDGLGWHVAQRLHETIDAHQVDDHQVDNREAGGGEVNDREADEVTVMARHQLTPELADAVSRASLVLFVDARENEEPGNVRCESVDPDPSTAMAFTHQMDPVGLLSCAKALYGSCPPAFSLSIAGEDFGYAEVLSDTVHAAIPDLMRRLGELITAGRRRGMERGIETGEIGRCETL